MPWGRDPDRPWLRSRGDGRRIRTPHTPPTLEPLHPVTFYLGILLAFCCALATQLGFLYKHRGACATANVDVRHPLRTGKALFSSRWFAIGMGVATSAWSLHVAAMAFAPLSVVQAVLS